MKAAVYERYGPPDVVRVAERPMPDCKPGEVLVRVHAATVSTADWRARTLSMPPGFGLMGRPMFGFRGPRNTVLGADFAGIVETVGAGVTRFKPGDAVFGMSGLAMGGHAEYLVISADGAIVKKPETLSFAEAAGIPFGGTAALYFLRDRAKLKKGESVAINGAAGAVGTAAVQIARAMGLEVTAVCSKANADLVRGLGADHVVDYNETDFTAETGPYDAIFDPVGNAPFARSRSALKPGGRLLAVLGGLGDMLLAPWHTMTTPYEVHAGPAPEKAEDLAHLAALAEAGQFRPVIDSVYPLDRAAEAHARVETGHKRGNVVLAIVPETA